MIKNHLILFILVTLSPLGIDLHLSALTDIKQYFSITAHEAQLSVLTFVFAMGIGQLLWGVISILIAKRTVVLISCLLFIIASLAIVFTKHYGVLLCLRVLQGLAASGLSVIACTTVNENFKGNKAAIIFSIQSGFLNVIPAVAPVIGAVLLMLGSWKLIFIAFTVYGMCTYLAIHKTYHYHEYSSIDNSIIMVLKNLLSDTQFITYTSVCVYGLGFIMTYISIAPIIMVDTFGHSPMSFSLYFAANAVIIAAVSFSLAKIITLLGAQRCLLIGIGMLIVASNGLYIVSLHLTVVGFWLCIGLGSIGFSMSLGPAMSQALAQHQAQSQIASGVLGCCYLSLSSLIGIAITATESYSVSVFGASFVLGGMLIITAIIFQKKTRQTSL